MPISPITSLCDKSFVDLRGGVVGFAVVTAGVTVESKRLAEERYDPTYCDYYFNATSNLTNELKIREKKRQVEIFIIHQCKIKHMAL